MESSDSADRAKHKVVTLRTAIKEAKSFLQNGGTYWYVVEIVRRLVFFGDPEELWDLRIKPIGEFHELCLKGNMLGKINCRVYFKFIAERKEVLILKTYKKEEDGKTPRFIIINLEDRLCRLFQFRKIEGTGNFGVSESQLNSRCIERTIMEEQSIMTAAVKEIMINVTAISDPLVTADRRKTIEAIAGEDGESA